MTAVPLKALFTDWLELKGMGMGAWVELAKEARSHSTGLSTLFELLNHPATLRPLSKEKKVKFEIIKWACYAKLSAIGFTLPDKPQLEEQLVEKLLKPLVPTFTRKPDFIDVIRVQVIEKLLSGGKVDEKMVGSGYLHSVLLNSDFQNVFGKKAREYFQKLQAAELKKARHADQKIAIKHHYTLVANFSKDQSGKRRLAEAFQGATKSNQLSFPFLKDQPKPPKIQ